MGWRDLIPYAGSTTTRQRLDHVFSRQMLGSVLLGAAAGKIVEKTLLLALDSTLALLAGWTGAFAVFLVAFVYWDRLER